MSEMKQQHWYDAYRYTGRNLKLFWDKNGGAICTIAGTTGLIFAGAHACRKTYKIHDKLKKNGEAIYLAEQADENGSRIKKVTNKAKAFISCSAKTAVDYLPDIAIGTLSGVAVAKGWQKEHKNYRNAAAVAGVLAADFMNYRRNVIDEQGVEADRRYLTTKKEHKKIREATLEDGTKLQSTGKSDESDGIVVDIEPNMLKIWYSEQTTPQVWSTSHAIRMHHLQTIQRNLESLLIYGGHYSVNDVRREFYGVKGDVAAGGMFGRVWDPGNPDHPERGAMINLHYQEDEDFMSGLTDSCWIIIDIDDEPLIETLAIKSIEDIPGVEEIRTAHRHNRGLI